MPHRIERINLPSPSAGTRREIVAHRFGRGGARPKVYIQAALHADELPGQLVCHHLIRRLIAQDEAGAIVGEILVVPMANPIGRGQYLLGRHIGRFELDSGANFNRDYPDLAARAGDIVADDLDGDAVANVARIRAGLVRAIDEYRPSGELGAMRMVLMRLAIDADIVLDLHCDLDAEIHLYLAPTFWPGASDLAGEIGAKAILLAAASGGRPFDEAVGSVWLKLAGRFSTTKPVPADACLTATVELRGALDVDDAMAEADAAALHRFLQRRGVIAGDPGPRPRPSCAATPLAGVDTVKALVGGLILFRKSLGSPIAAGEVVAEIVDIGADDPGTARTPLRAATSGRLFARALEHLARPGQTIVKIAGGQPLPNRVGDLLDP